MSKITRIVLTGGPCAGKSTALAAIQKRFSSAGYKVFIVPETPTDLIAGMGITPNMLDSGDWSRAFQSMVTSLQMSKEEAANWAALEWMQAHPENGKSLIICDRGLMDQTAYIDKNTMRQVIAPLSLDDALARYDGVIHLVTAAIGAEDAYNHGNIARSESVEEAAKLDWRTMLAWTGHPHFRVVDNSTGFEEKIERVIREICDILGDPVPAEKEYKFLIKKPSIEMLEKVGAVKTTILQTYLRPTDGCDERRVRQRSVYGDNAFYYTEKSATSIKGERIEIERRIKQDEYLRYLLTEADTSKHGIMKSRYCFVHENQYFELDIYEGDLVGKGNAILEIELTGDGSGISIPDYIKVIKDVTGEDAYSNCTLAGM